MFAAELTAKQILTNSNRAWREESDIQAGCPIAIGAYISTETKSLLCIGGPHGKQIQEFREMIKAFHRAGIEVILDVVLNHSAEGDELGPTISLGGNENSIFYMLQENGRRYQKNFSGVGNTLKANHPVVREFVRNVLRYWVTHQVIEARNRSKV